MKKSKRSIFVENKMKLLLIEDDINACEIFKKIERARERVEGNIIVRGEIYKKKVSFL